MYRKSCDVFTPRLRVHTCTLLILANRRRNTLSLSSQVRLEMSTLVSGFVGREDGGPGSSTEISLETQLASRAFIQARAEDEGREKECIACSYIRLKQTENYYSAVLKISRCMLLVLGRSPFWDLSDITRPTCMSCLPSKVSETQKGYSLNGRDKWSYMFPTLSPKRLTEIWGKIEQQ